MGIALASTRCYNANEHMQIIKGKHYNEFQIGGFILLVPVYGKEGEYFVLGEMKSLMLSLQEFSDKAHEENKKMYLEAREEYTQAHQQLNRVSLQLIHLPQTDDIETLETKRQLAEEKRKLERDLYHLSELIYQLYHKDFIPQKTTSTTTLITQPEPISGDTVRQIRTALGETQDQFAKRFYVPPGRVSEWENDKRQPPQEVLEQQATVEQTS